MVQLRGKTCMLYSKPEFQLEGQQYPHLSHSVFVEQP